MVAEYHRGAASFVHDHERLSRIRDTGQLPVVATDEPRVVDALLRESPGWIAVLLWQLDSAVTARTRRGYGCCTGSRWWCGPTWSTLRWWHGWRVLTQDERG